MNAHSFQLGIHWISIKTNCCVYSSISRVCTAWAAATSSESERRSRTKNRNRNWNRNRNQNWARAAGRAELTTTTNRIYMYSNTHTYIYIYLYIVLFGLYKLQLSPKSWTRTTDCRYTGRYKNHVVSSCSSFGFFFGFLASLLHKQKEFMFCWRCEDYKIWQIMRRLIIAEPL